MLVISYGPVQWRGTEKPGMLQFKELRRVGHNLVNEQQQQHNSYSFNVGSRNMPQWPVLCPATWCTFVGAYVLSCFSHVQLFTTLWTVACQAPLSMGLSRQEYWSGLPFPSPGDLPNPAIETASPVAPALQADSLLLSHLWSPK